MINQIRSFLQDRGITITPGPSVLARKLPELLGDEEGRLTTGMKRLLTMLREQWSAINVQVEELEAELRAVVEQDDACGRLASIPGIGAITATAIVAAIGDGRMFRSGRDFAAWLGLVPRQHFHRGALNVAWDQQTRKLLHPNPADSRLSMHAEVLQGSVDSGRSVGHAIEGTNAPQCCCGRTGQ